MQYAAEFALRVSIQKLGSGRRSAHMDHHSYMHEHAIRVSLDGTSSPSRHDEGQLSELELNPGNKIQTQCFRADHGPPRLRMGDDETLNVDLGPGSLLAAKRFTLMVSSL